jgi:hypothetical protein
LKRLTRRAVKRRVRMGHARDSGHSGWWRIAMLRQDHAYSNRGGQQNGGRDTL